MKLAELQTIAHVKEGGTGAGRQNFRESDGWDLTFQQGIVTVRKENPTVHRLVPMANVAWMTPAEEPKPQGSK